MLKQCVFSTALRTLRTLLPFLFLLLLVTPVPQGLRGQAGFASSHAPTVEAPLTHAEQKAVIDTLSSLLNRAYIFPAMAPKMVDFITRRFSSGGYDSLRDPQLFASQLRLDLISVSHDLHFNIIFDPGWVSAQKAAVTKQDSLDLLSRDSLRGAQNNYGFAEVKILPGNIGYLHLTQFENPAFGGATAAAAMQLLSHTDALIIDLRNNGGGYASMVQLLASYLFDPEPVHIIDIYSRENRDPATGQTGGTQTNTSSIAPTGAIPSNTPSRNPANSETGTPSGPQLKNSPPANSTDFHPSDFRPSDFRQDWTLPYLPGHRMPDIDVYVLTNNQTFSAAESFSYFLKNRKRATIVGQTTGGGAHMVDRKILTDRFYIFMPVERPVDPITGTDWEGTGVKPDTETSSNDALTTAHELALKKQSALHPENLTLTWTLAALKAEQHPLTLPLATLQAYTGLYGDRRITFDGARIFYQRIDPTQPTGTTPKTAGSQTLAATFVLIPLASNLFMSPEFPHMQLQFIIEKGHAVAMKRTYDDGRSFQDKKTQLAP